MNKAVIKLQRNEDEEFEDFVVRTSQVLAQEQQRILREVDRSVGAGYRSLSTMDAPKLIANTINAKARARKQTLADYLAEKPQLIQLIKEGIITL